MKNLPLAASLSILAFVILGLRPTKDPARWTSKVTSLNGTQVVELRLEADIDEGWHMYSSDNNSEYSPIPARISFTSPAAYKLLGKLVSINAEKLYEPHLGVKTELFRKRAILLQKVKLLKPSKHINGVIEYMACTDEDGVCIFRKVPFEARLQ